MIPAILAVFYPTSPMRLPDVIKIVPLHEGIPLKTQAKRALSDWMERDDIVQIDHHESGNVAHIVTPDGETVDVFAVEVPESKRREAISRFVRHSGFDPGPWSSFTDEQAIDWARSAGLNI